MAEPRPLAGPRPFTGPDFTGPDVPERPPVVPIAVAGLGGRGLHLADRLREHPGFRLTAVCDPDGSARGRCGGLGVPAVADLADLPPDTAAVAVAVPAARQRGVIERVLGGGRACAAHPPLGCGPAGWDELVDAASRAGRPLLVLRPSRWEPRFATVRTAADAAGGVTAVTRTGWAATTVPPPADLAAAARGRLEGWLDELVALCAGCGEPSVLAAVRRDGPDETGWAVTVRFGECGPVATLDLLRGAAVALDTGWLLSGEAGGGDPDDARGREPDGELFPRTRVDGPADDWPDALHRTLSAGAPWSVTPAQTATVLRLLGEVGTA